MVLIRVAVCGIGRWGQNYLRVLSGVGGCQLVGFADANPDRLFQMAKHYSHQVISTDPQEILDSDSVEAVILATPPQTHVELCRRALRQGKHVLVEKPIGLNAEEVCELFQVAKERQKILMVGHLMEYHPAIEAIKQVIESDSLGDIRYVQMSRTHLNDYPAAVGALWDLAVHDLSVTRYLWGACPCAVAVKGIGSNPETPDAVFLQLDLRAGVQVIPVFITVSQITPGKCRKITVVGTKRSVEFDDTLVEKMVRVMGMNEMVSMPVPPAEPLAVECRHFLECIAQGIEPRTAMEDALWVTEILEKAQSSINCRESYRSDMQHGN